MIKNSSLFFILLLLSSCSTQRISTSPEPSLSPTNELISENENFKVNIQFIETIYDSYEFEIAIKNKSNGSVLVESSMFKYDYSLNEKEIDQ